MSSANGGGEAARLIADIAREAYAPSAGNPYAAEIARLRSIALRTKSAKCRRDHLKAADRLERKARGTGR